MKQENKHKSENRPYFHSKTNNHRCDFTLKVSKVRKRDFHREYRITTIPRKTHKEPCGGLSQYGKKEDRVMQISQAGQTHQLW